MTAAGRDLPPGAGRLVVISGPSGSGKTSICKALAADPRVAFSISATTRQRRTGEVDGRDYFFLSDEDFEARVQRGAFLEHARYNDRRYGTLRDQVEQRIAEGRIVLLEIEVQGTRQLRENGVDGVYVFVMPPSFAELERRLRERRTEDEAGIRRRLDIARREMEMAHLYDHVVVNLDLEVAIASVRRLVGLDSPTAGSEGGR